MSENAQVMHIADTHIGYTQYGRQFRRDDFLEAFNRCMGLAIERDVAAVIHGGDLFHDNQPGLEELNGIVRCLQRLQSAGIPFLGITGNHERRNGGHWIDFLTDLGLATHLGPEPVDIAGVPVYGLDYQGRRDVELPQLNGGVLVAHQMLDEIIDKGELSLEACAQCGADVVLLGDFHGQAQWRRNGTIVTYPGSTERVSVTERAPRGANFIDLHRGRLDRVRIDGRPFLYLDEDVERTLQARRHQLSGTVVVARFDSNAQLQDIRRIAEGHGAAYVHALPADELESSGHVEPPPVTLEVDNFEEELERRLSEVITLDATREIEAIVRDLSIPDSQVDPAVTEVLKKHLPTARQYSESGVPPLAVRRKAA